VETEDQVTLNFNPSIRVYAQKNWGTTKLTTTYTLFTPTISVIGSAPWVGQGPGLSDIARHKPVTVSSTETANTPASCAIDGDRYFRWASSASDPQWIQVDLQSTYNVNLVKLTWEAAYGRAYQIQVSLNGTTWTTVYSTTTGDGGVDSIPLTPVQARYVRMYGTARGTTNGYSLWEFEVYGTSTPILAGNGTLFSANRVTIHGPTGTKGTIAIGFDLCRKQKNVRFDVYTMLGQKVYGTNFENIKNGTRWVSLNRTMSGIYVCVIGFDDTRITEKIFAK
jgi:hexosaminidase